MRKTTLPLLATGLALLAALPSRAEVFSVKLTSGGVFETRYEPKTAPWDATMVVFVDETGLRIALPKSLIADVTALSETKGFGRLINTTTVDLGFMPNDMPQQGQQAGNMAQNQLEAMLASRPQSYDQQQFVEPSEAGGGIPVYGASGYSGVPQLNQIPQVSAPRPAAPLAPAMGSSPGVITPSSPPTSPQ